MKKINLIVICLNTLFLILNAFILFKNLDNEKHEKSNTQNSSYSHSKNINEPKNHNRKRARQKACYSNIRVLQSAVEMYNMDVGRKNKMEVLDLSKLMSTRYLKAAPTCPGTGISNYNTFGNLSNNGVIGCENEPI